jgi:hypothetical protein
MEIDDVDPVNPRLIHNPGIDSKLEAAIEAYKEVCPLLCQF